MGVVFWGCEEVKVERMEAADVFLMACLVGGATEWLGALPLTMAAVVATGLEVTVTRDEDTGWH